MLKKRLGILVGLFLIMNTHIFAIHSITFTDNLYHSLSEKGVKSSQKLDILYEIINYHYLSNQYDDMKFAIDEAYSLLSHNSDSCLINRFLLLEAKYTLAAKNRSKAISLANKILTSSQYNHCPKTEISTLLFQAKILLNEQDIDTCLHKINDARKLAMDIKDEVLIARTHNMEAVLYLLKNRFKESRKLLFLALETFEKYDEDALTGKAYSDLAYTYYLQSVYDSALIYNSSAIPFLEKGRSYSNIVINYNNMALAYQNKGKINEAIEIYFEGLKIAEQLNMASNKILILYNIGNCYYSLDAKEKAINSFRLCLQESQMIKDTISIIYLCNAIGYTSLENKRIDTAIKYINRAYELSVIIDNHYTLMFCSASMASLEIESMNFKLAQEFLNDSYRFAREMNNPNDFINIDMTQAELYAKQKKYNKAIALLNDTYKNVIRIDSKENARYVLIALAEIYEESGDLKNALIYSKKVKNYQDSINSVSILANLVNIENQYEQNKLELIRQLELENTELEKLSELRKTRFVAIIAIICTITFIIISLLFYFLSRSRNIRNQSLKEKNKLIETHSDDLEKLVLKLQNITSDLDLANKTKSKLLTIIGHDLRSPFNVIKGYISLLTENDIDPSEREIYYERINNASDQLMEMVDNLLIWTKTQSKKIIPNLTKTDITKIANQSVALLQNNANLKEIQIIADFDNKQSTTIKVDPEMLTRIIHNLLVNAIKFTNKNGQVHLGFMPEKSSMKFWVKDNGVGMNPEDAATIFENSTDFVKSGTAGEKGTGLGLSICHDFVKYHKGTIWAESELGVGSSFIFTLPIS